MFVKGTAWIFPEFGLWTPGHKVCFKHSLAIYTKFCRSANVGPANMDLQIWVIVRPVALIHYIILLVLYSLNSVSEMLAPHFYPFWHANEDMRRPERQSDVDLIVSLLRTVCDNS